VTVVEHAPPAKGPAADADAPCYELVEEVPSGLAPLPSWEVAAGGSVVGPSSVVGQRVTFCVSNPVLDFPDRAGPSPTAKPVREATLVYVARVVNEGTFTWEPAILQLEGAADVGTTVLGGSVSIGTK
jgi:hypothetical protein